MTSRLAPVPARIGLLKDNVLSVVKKVLAIANQFTTTKEL